MELVPHLRWLEVLKVRGHATEVMLAEGLSDEGVIGNYVADKLADVGAASAQVAPATRERYNMFVDEWQKWVHYVIREYRAVQELAPPTTLKAEKRHLKQNRSLFAGTTHKVCSCAGRLVCVRCLGVSGKLKGSKRGWLETRCAVPGPGAPHLTHSMVFGFAFTKFVCRKCGVGLKFKLRLLGLSCRKDAERARFQALTKPDLQFELEVLSPEAETSVGDAATVLDAVGSVGGCVGASVAHQRRSHDLDDSQASPVDVDR